MRLRIALLVSIVLNLGLAAVLYYLAHMAPPESFATPLPGLKAAAPTNTVKTRVIVRKQFFSWDEIESDDYATYILNLRAINCPESTIRDIIVADINQLYARKQASIVGTSDQHWWRSTPDPESLQATADKFKALETERRDLLTQLLGSGWDVASYNPNLTFPTASAIDLSGPVLGELSSEAKQAVRRITSEGQKRQQAYIEAQQKEGQPVDPAELARLRQDTRQELSQVLNPMQLEEYLLRFSTTAAAMRRDFEGFDVTPEEFRKIFELRDSIDQQMSQYEGKSDPSSAKALQKLEQDQQAAMKQALGPERYAVYQMARDPAFQDAKATAEQYGAPPDLVLPIYQVNQLSLAEQLRINTDPTLSPEERDRALEDLRSQRDTSVRLLLNGQPAPELPTVTNMPPLPEGMPHPPWPRP